MIHAGGSDLRHYDGPDLKLFYRREGPDFEFGKRAKTLVSSRVHRDLNISLLLLQYSSVYITVESSVLVYLGAYACILTINQCPIHHSSVTL